MAEGDYMPRIVAVRVVRDRVVHLTFDDGLEGDVDLAPRMPGPVLSRISASDEEFGKVTVDWETVVWPGDADLAPEPLYDAVAGAAVLAQAPPR